MCREDLEGYELNHTCPLSTVVGIAQWRKGSMLGHCLYFYHKQAWLLQIYIYVYIYIYIKISLMEDTGSLRS